jgi:hypothetical protein
MLWETKLRMTSSTTITLSCLASATSWIAFGPIELHHAAHFNINENFVPVDFLAFVSTALLESYPQSESLAYSENGVTISSAVGDLLDSLRRDFEKLPLEFAGQVLAPVKAGLVVWLADELRLANDAFGARVGPTILFGRVAADGHPSWITSTSLF